MAGTGSWQRFAVAVIEARNQLDIYDWKNTLTLRWASSHLGAEEENFRVAVARDCLCESLDESANCFMCYSTYLVTDTE